MPDSRKTFHVALDEIREELVRMAALVTEAIPRGTEALLAGDSTAAQALIDADDDLDRRASIAEDRCFHLLARQAPVAGDMRAVVTAIRLVAEVERSGDLMVNVAKATVRLRGVDLPARLRGLLSSMADEARHLFELAVDAYVEGDQELAGSLRALDDRLDEVHRAYIGTLLDPAEADLPLGPVVQLALIGRYYERIGDHAVNIGERVRYMVTGWLPDQPASVETQTGRQAG